MVIDLEQNRLVDENLNDDHDNNYMQLVTDGHDVDNYHQTRL